MSSSFRFSLAATFTADPLKPILHFWGRQLHLEYDVRLAPYNQVEQTLLNPTGPFAVNGHGVNVVAIRLEDLGGFDLSRIRSNIDHLVDVVRSAQARLTVPLILCLCPESIAFRADAKRTRAAGEIAALIRGNLAHAPGAHFLDYRQIEEIYPVKDGEAPGGGELGHIPYNETYYVALGTAIVRRAHALIRPPFKVIALDCDDTLWKGICGEDGPSGIFLDEPRRELQEFMLKQHKTGMLLTIASKNNEPDVIEAFEQNPAMPLQLRHFTARRINWESKAENLAALSKQLELGLDSFIFVDDNPKECAEVESSAPDVLSVPLPAEAGQIGQFLNGLWAFDHGPITVEDRQRSDFYAQSMQFGAEMRATDNLQQFMSHLQLGVRIEPLTRERIRRVAQLTQRTNQFNFTSVRRSESEIQRLLEAEPPVCFTVDVSDRFGDYGLTGTVIVAGEGEDLIIDTFLLSCRVLGRGVEHRVMAFVAEVAASRGAVAVVAHFRPTDRNAPAQQFLESIGEKCNTESGGVVTCRFPLASVRGLEWRPAAAVAASAAPSRPRVSTATQRPDYVRIAQTLSTPAQILAEMRREKRVIFSPPAVDPPSTETEIRLAEIWADLLQAPAISASDNFFDLGGHSLLAVLLLVRIQEAFGIELTIDDVYSGSLTLAELAQRIEMGDSPEYTALLQEIQAMSDEEARQLLAEEPEP